MLRTSLTELHARAKNGQRIKKVVLSKETQTRRENTSMLVDNNNNENRIQTVIPSEVRNDITPATEHINPIYEFISQPESTYPAAQTNNAKLETQANNEENEEPRSKENNDDLNQEKNDNLNPQEDNEDQHHRVNNNPEFDAQEVNTASDLESDNAEAVVSLESTDFMSLMTQDNSFSHIYS